MKRNALKICMEWQCFLPKCGRCVDVFTYIEMFEHLCAASAAAFVCVLSSAYSVHVGCGFRLWYI